MNTLKNLHELYADFQKKSKAHNKLHWKLMCRFGVHSDPKMKRKPAHEVIGSKLDLQVQESKKLLNEAEEKFLAAFNEEKSRWNAKYWYLFHSWNKKFSSDHAKDIVSGIRSMLNNHTNLSRILEAMGGDVNSRTNRYYTVRHFRHKGFECDCDYCALNVYLGNRLYDKFYLGTPKNDISSILMAMDNEAAVCS